MVVPELKQNLIFAILLQILQQALSFDSSKFMKGANKKILSQAHIL